MRATTHLLLSMDSLQQVSNHVHSLPLGFARAAARPHACMYMYMMNSGQQQFGTCIYIHVYICSPGSLLNCCWQSSNRCSFTGPVPRLVCPTPGLHTMASAITLAIAIAMQAMPATGALELHVAASRPWQQTSAPSYLDGNISPNWCVCAYVCVEVISTPQSNRQCTVYGELLKIRKLIRDRILSYTCIFTTCTCTITKNIVLSD